jgi:hypothetical protein
LLESIDTAEASSAVQVRKLSGDHHGQKLKPLDASLKSWINCIFLEGCKDEILLRWHVEVAEKDARLDVEILEG